MKRVTLVKLFVNNQDEALEFYTAKLGFEVVEDSKLGDYRWLLVRLPDNREFALNLDVATLTSLGPRTHAPTEMRRTAIYVEHGLHVIFQRAAGEVDARQRIGVNAARREGGGDYRGVVTVPPCRSGR